MSDLNENTEYIEAYFTGQLSHAEKKQFEEQCNNDELFAKEVSVFITAQEGIRQKLLAQKKQQWAQFSAQKSKTRPETKIIFIKWLPYVAAACVLFAVVFYKLQTPQTLANNYVSEHFSKLSPTMAASGTDSLQLGISAYNSKDYPKALQVFEQVYQSSQQSKAKEYIGLVFLVTKKYDKALQHFGELAGMKGLHSNPGMFLQAITLLNRNDTGDKEQARRLLEQIIKEGAEGKTEAKKWLKRW